MERELAAAKRERREDRARGENVRRNPKYSRRRRGSAAVMTALLQITKMLIRSFLDAASCAKMALETRGTPWIRNRDVPHVRRTGVLSIEVVNAERTFY